MDNDAFRHEVDDVLARAEDQIRGLSQMQQKQSALTAKVTVADGTVEVTVNAQHVLTKVEIDEGYLDEFELAELGNYITDAVQAASADIDRRAAELLTPLTEGHQSLSELPALLDMPDIQQLLSGLNLSSLLGLPQESPATNDGGNGEFDSDPRYPTVRRDSDV